MSSSKKFLTTPLSLEYLSSNNPDDPSSSFTLFESLSQGPQLYSPEILSNSRYSSFQYSSATCRFGHGLPDDPRPPSLPMHQFRQLACSSCLLYVATVKQKCNLEYLATPDGLISTSFSPERVCLRHNHNPVTRLGGATEIPGNQVVPTPHSQGKLSRLLTIPADLTSRNFFCDVLLQGEDEHCNLWRECCKAAINCCKHKLRISKPTDRSSGDYNEANATYLTPMPISKTF